MGLALIMYGREEGAETLVEQMTRDQDPILRYPLVNLLHLAFSITYAYTASDCRLEWC